MTSMRAETRTRYQRDQKRREDFEKGHALGYYIRGTAKKLLAPTTEDVGKVERKTKRRSLRRN